MLDLIVTGGQFAGRSWIDERAREPRNVAATVSVSGRGGYKLALVSRSRASSRVARVSVQPVAEAL